MLNAQMRRSERFSECSLIVTTVGLGCVSDPPVFGVINRYTPHVINVINRYTPHVINVIMRVNDLPGRWFEVFMKMAAGSRFS
jgi:hypothetical protein